MSDVKNMPFIKRATEELHKGFDLLNKTFFPGEELEIPTITIQNQGNRKLVLGWCSTVPFWEDGQGEIKKYEINITAEYLNRDWVDTMQTLLHEMVHLYNSYHGVQDCSRGNVYHNRRFKEEAEKRGLVVQHSKELGWAHTSLSPEAEEKIRAFDIDPEAFKIYRIPRTAVQKKTKGGKGSSTRKMVCPSCGNIARITKDYRLKCGECEEYMVQVDAD